MLLFFCFRIDLCLDHVTCPKNIHNMKVLFIMLILRRKFVKYQQIRTQSNVRGNRFTVSIVPLWRIRENPNMIENVNVVIWYSTVKPAHAVTCIKRSPFSCPVIENFICSTKPTSSHLNLICSRHDIAEKLLTWC
jgi:hypothetical protein